MYVEKPLVLDEAEAEELIRIAKEKNLVLMVGHLLQYHPVFTRLKELALSGELGRINYIYSNRLNLGKIRREENILWSFAPHDISMILALTGEEPKVCLPLVGIICIKKLRMSPQLIWIFRPECAPIFLCPGCIPLRNKNWWLSGIVRWLCLMIPNPGEDKLLLYPHEIHWHNNLPVPAKADPERVEISQEEPLRVECQHFLDCITRGKRPLTDGEEGLRVFKNPEGQSTLTG